MGVSVTGGKKLRAHFRKMRTNMAEAESVEVGFFPEDIHPKSHIPVATVAAINEYGDPYNTLNGHPAPIPPRPFFRTTIAVNSAGWGTAFTAGLKSVNYHMQPALDGLGALIQMQLRNSIVNWRAPMNAPFTIRMKGFNDPLMETGYLLDHVKYKVQV